MYILIMLLYGYCILGWLELLNYLRYRVEIFTISLVVWRSPNVLNFNFLGTNVSKLVPIELRHEKTGFLHMRK